jgi:uncharacterized protein (TIGR00730 family)
MPRRIHGSRLNKSLPLWPKPVIKTLCVYAASSDAVAPRFFELAAAAGRMMAQRHITLVYGGGQIGLMGAVARAVHTHGGRVVGVIPHYLRRLEIAYEAADELVVAPDLRERKAIMEERAEAFLALPGGFGTLEEVLEILTLKQLGRHAKPIVFLNADGFFDPLLAQFARLYRDGFTKPAYRDFYFVAAKPEEAFAYLEAYAAPDPTAKWIIPPSGVE